MPRKTSKPRQLTAADIFSGAGGLTTGLKTGGFRVLAGVEIEGHAVATFKINHPEIHTFKQDVTTVTGGDLLDVAPEGRIDLLAGCPPCQGFTSLTSKYRRTDSRNRLVIEMVRLVEEVQPLAVMMENVPGLAQKGKPLFDEFLSRIEAQGYVPEWDVLQVADYGVPQSRRRLVLLAGRGFHIKLPPATYSRTGEGGLPKWKTVGSMLRGMPKPVTLAEANEQGGAQSMNWHVVRSLSGRNQSRLRHARPGKPWRNIPKRLRPVCHQDKGVGFSNVYGRMSWDEVSPTITAGCTTLSKGRFGHPDEDRTISAYEAALLQTFPADYVFSCPYMEYVCSMIGNALPCDFAAALASQCAEAIRQHEQGAAGRR
ncbi:MAG: DNA cytosine methyltransferase [Isosphaeraceae bacterium]